MIYEQRGCGLIVPKANPPNAPQRKYAPLELPTEEQRRVAMDALSMLWDALELSNPPGIVLPGKSQAAYDAHYHAYRYIGEMLLGKDCPGKRGSDVIAIRRILNAMSRSLPAPGRPRSHQRLTASK